MHNDIFTVRYLNKQGSEVGFIEGLTGYEAKYLMDQAKEERREALNAKGIATVELVHERDSVALTHIDI